MVYVVKQLKFAPFACWPSCVISFIGCRISWKGNKWAEITMERESIRQQPKWSFQGNNKGIWRRKGGEMSKNLSPELTSELQWAVNVSFLRALWHWGSPFNTSSTRNAQHPPHFPGCIPPSRACTAGGMFGNGWWMFLLYPRAPSALLLWFHPWAGLCWGCMGSTRGCAGSAAGSRVPRVTECAWENSCDFITTFVPFVLLKAGGVKEGKLMQSGKKVGSSKLCYRSSTVPVISGFLLEFWGQRGKWEVKELALLLF